MRGGSEPGGRLRVSLVSQKHNKWRAKLAKASKLPDAPIVVRTRRAYFDCHFGQLHVRTAFPTTGGFDEQVTLVCLHPIEGSSRTFARLLPSLPTCARFTPPICRAAANPTPRRRAVSRKPPHRFPISPTI